MKPLLLVTLAISLFAAPAFAKQEALFIEKVALLAVNQGVCGVAATNEAMQTAIGAAMIQQALTKAVVIERARKRAYAIGSDIQRNGTQKTFCSAFMYYLDKGYPR
jgi:hypothetical protein